MAFLVPNELLCDFTVCCRGCGENIPAPVGTMPDSWIVAACPLCGERRRYLPPEIFRGRLSVRLVERLAASGIGPPAGEASPTLTPVPADGDPKGTPTEGNNKR